MNQCLSLNFRAYFAASLTREETHVILSEGGLPRALSSAGNPSRRILVLFFNLLKTSTNPEMLNSYRGSLLPHSPAHRHRIHHRQRSRRRRFPPSPSQLSRL